MTTGISVDRLSKEFVIGTPSQPSMLREALINMVKAPFGRRPRRDTIWALRDVSLSRPAG